MQSWETLNWYQQAKYESTLLDKDLALAICQYEWPPIRESLQNYQKLSFLQAEKKCDKFRLTFSFFLIRLGNFYRCCFQPKKLVTPNMKPNLTRENLNCGSGHDRGKLEDTVSLQFSLITDKLSGQQFKIWTGYSRFNNTHFSDGRSFIQLELGSKLGTVR